MTSLSLTEDEIVKVLLGRPSSFEQIVSKLWKARKMRRVTPGSRSTISLALKSLYRKRFAEYDPVKREWQVTSLGRWIMGKGVIPSKPALALTQVTQPLLRGLENQPKKLIELLSTMFVYSLARSEKFSPEEEVMRKQTETKLTLFTKEYANAIEAIWGDAAELLVGHLSSLMAAILLHRSSLDQDDKTSASATIPKIVEQYFKPLVVELGEFLSKSLADLDELAALERNVKVERER